MYAIWSVCLVVRNVFFKNCTGGAVIEDEEGEIPSTCTFSLLGKCSMTCLDVCVIYLITGCVAEAIIEFFNVTREISKKDHVYLALFNSFLQISRLMDGMLKIASATLLLLLKPICC